MILSRLEYDPKHDEIQGHRYFQKQGDTWNGRHMWYFSYFLFPARSSRSRVASSTRPSTRPEPDVEVSYILHETGDVTVMRDTTDSKGQFILDVPSDPGAEPPPMLFARYNGIDYPGNPAPAGDTVDIPVFETTESDTAISLSSHHILLDAQAGTVTYIFIVHNHGDRTYLTGGDPRSRPGNTPARRRNRLYPRTARRTPARHIARRSAPHHPGK